MNPKPPKGKVKRRASAREAALQVLHAVEEEGAYANLALNRVLEGQNLNKLDRGLATELVYGTLKWRGKVDWVLSRFLSRPLEKLDPWIREILRLGAYQLLFMDRIPVSAAC
nr:16S rRNA (cytosine(967)-C(5))-methyltransferase RsmB [Clostridia bacterium]